jgi:isoleucyl-tRNA synthetase
MQKERYVFKTDGAQSVQLDTLLTPELRREGWIMEMCSAIMEMRKERNCGLKDTIDLLIVCTEPELMDAVFEHKDELIERVFCKKIVVHNAVSNFRQTVLSDNVVGADWYFTIVCRIDENGKYHQEKMKFNLGLDK